MLVIRQKQFLLTRRGHLSILHQGVFFFFLLVGGGGGGLLPFSFLFLLLDKNSFLLTLRGNLSILLQGDCLVCPWGGGGGTPHISYICVAPKGMVCEPFRSESLKRVWILHENGYEF